MASGVTHEHGKGKRSGIYRYGAGISSADMGLDTDTQEGMVLALG